MKKIFIIALVVLLSSCGAKKKTTYEKIVDRDSISYVLPSDNTFVVSNLCDTLNRPLELLKTISTGVSESVVEIKGNTLTIKTVTDTIFKDRITYKERVKLETKEVPYTPKWVKTLLCLLASCVVVFVVFPNIPRAIKAFAKKLIFPV